MTRAALVPGLIVGVAAILAVLNLATPAASPLHVSAYTISLAGKYLSYAVLALALDLVWGYVGILSLGHAAFFALGGYAMGMYLMRKSVPAASMATRTCLTSWCFSGGITCRGTGMDSITLPSL